MKLMNFHSLDQTYPGVGLKASGKADKDVWREFAADLERLRQTASAIRGTIEQTNMASIFIEPVIQEAPEGYLLTRTHIARERNRHLVKEKKASVLAARGRLACEVCSFDFEDAYGPRGNGFIECHHMKPLHTLRPGDITRINELALVCANCHRMIHAKHPWLAMDELRNLIRRNEN